MSFSNQLKIAMDERQMNQAELADALGMARSSVSMYLSGQTIPRKKVQMQIADILECTVDFLNSEPVQKTEGLKNVPIEAAAKALGKSEQFVRIALQTGVAPFGFAVKHKTVYSYHISPKKLAEYIGGCDGS